MENKASVNRPLMIIAAILAGIGFFLISIRIFEYLQWGFYSYTLSLIADIVNLLGVLFFAILLLLIAVTKIPFKLLAIPLCLYFIPIIIFPIINIFIFLSGSFSLWIRIISRIAVFVVLLLTLLKLITTKIPAIVVTALYVVLFSIDLALFGYADYSDFGVLLFLASILLMLFAFSTGEQHSVDREEHTFFEPQSLPLSIVLSIVTCGIYDLVWKYQLCRKIRILNNESTDCVGEYLCLILVPFYNLYWYYTRSQKLYNSMLKLKVPSSDSSVVNIVLSLFGLSIVSDALIQNDLNKAASVLQFQNCATQTDKSGSPIFSGEDFSGQRQAPSEYAKAKTKPENENIQLLQQLSDLHDKGILSDEEFETKKRDLLDRI